MRVGVAGNQMLCSIVDMVFRGSRDVTVIHLGGRGARPITNRILHLARILQCDVVHGFGYGNPELASAVLTGKPTIRHWIGSDVLRYCNKPLLRERLIYPYVKKHAAVTQELCQELRTVGIEAEVVPVFTPGLENCPILPMPVRFSVLTYWRSDVTTFYGAYVVAELARRDQDIQWYVVGSDLGPKLPNVTCLGWVDMSSVWPRVSAYFRFTAHDGLPKLLLEALARGRYAIWNRSLPGCLQVNTVDEAFTALQTLKAVASTPNLEAVDLVRTRYSTNVLRQTLRRLYESVLEVQG